MLSVKVKGSKVDRDLGKVRVSREDKHLVRTRVSSKEDRLSDGGKMEGSVRRVKEVRATCRIRSGRQRVVRAEVHRVEWAVQEEVHSERVRRFLGRINHNKQDPVREEQVLSAKE